MIQNPECVRSTVASLARTFSPRHLESTASDAAAETAVRRFEDWISAVEKGHIAYQEGALPRSDALYGAIRFTTRAAFENLTAVFQGEAKTVSENKGRESAFDFLPEDVSLALAAYCHSVASLVASPMMFGRGLDYYRAPVNGYVLCNLANKAATQAMARHHLNLSLPEKKITYKRPVIVGVQSAPRLRIIASS